MRMRTHWLAEKKCRRFGGSVVLACSLDGHELGTSGGTDTDLTVTNRLVGHGVLTEIVSDHIGSDFDRVPVLARVDFANGADHLGHDDAVSQMGLDG
jgi:hypothetical protein